MDEDGFIHFVDRIKDLIIASGYNIAPTEVESLIMKHDGVSEVGVVGVPDDYRGETVKAFVVLKDGKTALESEIMSFVNEKVAPFKAIREVEIRAELPMTLVGKVLKRELQEEEKKKASKS